MNLNRTITVKGKAEIRIIPDLTSVLINIREKESDYKKAFAKLQNKTQEIVQCANSAGVGTDNVKITNFIAQSIKKSERDRRGNFVEVDDGYACSQLVTIEFSTDADLLKNLINNISAKIEKPSITLRFSIADKSKFEAELIEKVCEDARSKADIFCRTSNAAIGRLITVDYQHNRPWTPPIIRNFGSTTILGDTGEFPYPVTPRVPVMQAPANPSMHTPAFTPPPVPTPNPPAPTPENLMPQEQTFEEEALFVWEIVDADQG